MVRALPKVRLRRLAAVSSVGRPAALWLWLARCGVRSAGRGWRPEDDLLAGDETLRERRGRPGGDHRLRAPGRSCYIIYVLCALVMSLGAQELDGRLVVAVDERGKRIARGVPDLAERPLQPGCLLRCGHGDKALFDRFVAANEFEERPLG
jgi:hypothetical protein